MYYGQPGSTLNQYKELQGIHPSMIHDVDVHWKNEQHVIINIMKMNQQHKTRCTSDLTIILTRCRIWIYGFMVLYLCIGSLMYSVTLGIVILI